MGIALIQHHMGTVGVPLVRDRRDYKLRLNCALLLIQWHTGEHLPTAADQTVSKTPHPEGRRAGDHRSHSTGTTGYCRARAGKRILRGQGH